MGEGSNKNGANYSIQDVARRRAWIAISEDPITGNSQQVEQCGIVFNNNLTSFTSTSENREH